MTAATDALFDSTGKVVATERVSSDRLLSLVVMALAFGIGMLTIAPWPVGVFQDDAIYVVLAKSLATGEGFRMINMPGSPHATHFPPGYPVLLAGLWKMYPTFPDNIVVFKFVNAVFLACTAFGTYRLCRGRLDVGPVGSAVAALIGTISVVVLVITGVVLSEPMFMALMLPTLLVTERAAERGDVRTALAAGALIGALSLVRTVGVFALPAAVIVMLARRHGRATAALAVAALVFIVPWQLWVSAYQGEMPGPFVGKYGAYGPWLAEGYRAGGMSFATAVLAKNANELFGFLGYVTLPVPPVFPRFISLGTVIGLLGLGAFLARRQVPVTILYLLGYGAVILVWPFEPMRFMLVWWPVIAALMVAGVRTIWRWQPVMVPARALRYAAFACVALIAGGYGYYNLRGVREKWWLNIQSQSATRAKPLAEWVARSTRPDDVLITDHDLIVYLYTERRAVPTATFTALGRITPLTPPQDAAILRELLSQYKPRWYIASSEQSIASATLLVAESPPRLRLAGTISTAQVYEPVSR
jgi:hypothetical protein